ncbi:MAG: hypothetical protein IJ243_07990 [Prevotella sp.]|nr:hypothetical protein [Prevotella sp.]
MKNDAKIGKNLAKKGRNPAQNRPWCAKTELGVVSSSPRKAAQKGESVQVFFLN